MWPILHLKKLSSILSGHFLHFEIEIQTNTTKIQLKFTKNNLLPLTCQQHINNTRCNYISNQNMKILVWKAYWDRPQSASRQNNARYSKHFIIASYESHLHALCKHSKELTRLCTPRTDIGIKEISMKFNFSHASIYILFCILLSLTKDK